SATADASWSNHVNMAWRAWTVSMAVVEHRWPSSFSAASERVSAAGSVLRLRLAWLARSGRTLTVVLYAGERERDPAGDPRRYQREFRSSVPAHDRPAGRDTESRAEHDIADEMTIVVQARHCHVARNHERRPRSPISSEMPLQHRGGGKRRRRVA